MQRGRGTFRIFRLTPLVCRHPFCRRVTNIRSGIFWMPPSDAPAVRQRRQSLRWQAQRSAEGSGSHLHTYFRGYVQRPLPGRLQCL